MSKIIYQCPIISKNQNARHGFFGKKGGVSLGDYQSLNCGYSSSDKQENVTRNRKIAVENLNLKTNKKICSLHQIHSNKVVIVDDEFLKSPQQVQADGFVTLRDDVVLSIITADCCPVAFIETKAKIIGLSHAGWRGAKSGILQNTIDKIVSLGGKKSNIVATIGPSIAQKSYEVSQEFYNEFVNDNIQNKKLFTNSVKSGHYMFDLTGYCFDAMQSCGIQKINNLNLDTCSLSDDFFSYRRKCLKDEKDFGRNISLISIEK